MTFHGTKKTISLQSYPYARPKKQKPLLFGQKIAPAGKKREGQTAGVLGLDGVEAGQCHQPHIAVGIVLTKIEGVECQEARTKFIGLGGIDFFVFVKAELGNHCHADTSKVAKPRFIQPFDDQSGREGNVNIKTTAPVEHKLRGMAVPLATAVVVFIMADRDPYGRSKVECVDFFTEELIQAHIEGLALLILVKARPGRFHGGADHYPAPLASALQI